MKIRIRMFWSALLAVILLAVVWQLNPEQGPVIVNKLALVHLFAYAGYRIDRWAFPYARPDKFLTDAGEVKVNHKRVFASAQIRRALVIGTAMLAGGLGL